VTAVLFAPDGKTLASAAEERSVRLWDSVTGVERRRLEFHDDRAPAIAFAPDGKALATAGTITRLWDVATGRELRRFSSAGSAQGVAFSPDGKTLVTGDYFGVIRLWDVCTGKQRLDSAGHVEWIWSVAISGDGKQVASGGQDGTVRLWEAASGKELRRFTGQRGNITTVALSPDGATLAAGGEDTEVHLWDVRSGQEVRTLKGHRHWLTCLAFAPDGKALASGSKDDQTSCLWDVASGKELSRLEGQTVSSVAFAPDGRTFAASSMTLRRGGELEPFRLWDVNTAKELRRIAVTAARSVAFTPNGKALAVANLEGELGLWDAANGNELRRFNGPEKVLPGNRAIYGVAFSPDGRTLLSTEGDGVFVWEVATGGQRAQFAGHQGNVLCVAAAGDGRTLVSSGADCTLLVWDLLGRVPGAAAAKLTSAEAESLWTNLASGDSATAFQALCKLAAAPDQAVSLTRQRLKPVRAADAQRMKQLLAELDDEAFAVRARAAKELEKLGDAAEPALRKALRGELSVGSRRRVEQLLEAREADRLRPSRALELLERTNTPEAQQELAALAEGDAEAWLTQLAQTSLQRLKSP
jgi:WD40 repeat protein